MSCSEAYSSSPTWMRGQARVIFIVTYDLRSGRERTPLFKALRSLGPSSHLMASTWAISTGKSPKAVASTLLAHLGPEDSILVSQLSETHVAHVTSQAAQWIAACQQSERERKARQLERERERTARRELRRFVESRATAINRLAVTILVPRSADFAIDATLYES